VGGIAQQKHLINLNQPLDNIQLFLFFHHHTTTTGLTSCHPCLIQRARKEVHYTLCRVFSPCSMFFGFFLCVNNRKTLGSGVIRSLFCPSTILSHKLCSGESITCFFPSFFELGISGSLTRASYKYNLFIIFVS
jgi:hypothetical protein